MKAQSKKLNGLVSLIILSLPLLLWQSQAIAQPSPTVKPNQSTVTSRGERRDTFVGRVSRLEKSVEPEGLFAQSNVIPCIDSSTECIEQLTERAIAFERHNILKLFFGLHLAGVITGTALSAINQEDLTKGAGLGFGISSINFGISLVLRSK